MHSPVYKMMRKSCVAAMLIIATTGSTGLPQYRAKTGHLRPPSPLFAHHPGAGLPHPAGVPLRGPRPLLYPLHYSGSAYQDPYHNTPAYYNFEHTVQDEYSGTYFGHREAREGHLTEGSYFVHLPDGRLQTVTYYADGTGFHPTVTYEGDALHHVGLPGPGPRRPAAPHRLYK